MLWRAEVIMGASEVEVAVSLGTKVGAEVGISVEVGVRVEAARRHQMLVLDIYLVAHRGPALVEVFHQIGCKSSDSIIILFRLLFRLYIELLLLPGAQMRRKAFPPFINKREIPQ